MIVQLQNRTKKIPCFPNGFLENAVQGNLRFAPEQSMPCEKCLTQLNEKAHIKHLHNLPVVKHIIEIKVATAYINL